MQNTTEKAIKKFSTRMQARLLLVFCVIILMLAGLIGRLIYIVHNDGDRYSKQVLSRQTYVSSVLPYKRGDILDRTGTVLARSEVTYRLILDPKNLILNSEYIVQTTDALKEYFGIEPEQVQSILEDRPESQYVILKKNLKYQEVAAFKAKMEEKSEIKSLWFEEEYIRNYPYGTLACDVIGFTTADNTGLWGIEEYYNEELNGTNGMEYGYYDASLNIERIINKAVNGNSIVTTIDANVQRIIQKHIAEFNEQTGSKSIGILVMDPNDSSIIAMASNQEYDLNDPRNLEILYTKEEIEAMTQEEKLNALNSLWKNDVISSGYEPGSTFKPFTVSAALEEALVSGSSTFVCDGGEHIGDYDISCNNIYGHGTLVLRETLMKSCNDALMQIGALLGRNNFYNYQTGFSFGRKTGIDLPGEAEGILISYNKLNATEIATSSFGQSFNVTMLQMAAAYSSLVNGGNYYRPHVASKIVNDEGATVKKIEPLLVKKTVSEETSRFIQETMYRTVEEGTAKPAKVPGYAIAGKTGTAEKWPRGSGTYLVSFLGHVPAINPEVVIYITIDEPQNVPKQDDSSIATKLASKVMAEILPALGIYPEGDIDYLLDNDNDQENADESNAGGNNAEEEETGGTPEENDSAQDGAAGTTGGNNNTQNSGAGSTSGGSNTQGAGNGNTSGGNDNTQGAGNGSTSGGNNNTQGAGNGSTSGENDNTQGAGNGNTSDGNDSTQDTDAGNASEGNNSTEGDTDDTAAGHNEGGTDAAGSEGSGQDTAANPGATDDSADGAASADEASGNTTTE
jgi:stage V sporulation protein D (sporulation-specific penicillin-binding protein)